MSFLNGLLIVIVIIAIVEFVTKKEDL